MNAREHQIVMLAHNLVGRANSNAKQIKPDACTTAAEFLLRFDLSANQYLSRMRTMMRAMLGQTGNAPLSLEDGLRWQLHLQANRDVRIVGQFGPNGGRLSVTGYQQYFDHELGSAIDHALGNHDDAELDRLHDKMLIEANQTSKILRELHSFMRCYDLVPSEHDYDNFAPIQLRRMFEASLAWVTWGDRIPQFAHDPVIFLENRIGNGVTRVIRVFPSATGRWQTIEDGSGMWTEDKHGNKQMPIINQIRTWTIYCLTKRGGGRLSEDDARSMWNHEFGKYSIEDTRLFREQRDAIFGKAKKRRT